MPLADAEDSSATAQAAHGLLEVAHIIASQPGLLFRSQSQSCGDCGRYSVVNGDYHTINHVAYCVIAIARRSLLALGEPRSWIDETIQYHNGDPTANDPEGGTDDPDDPTDVDESDEAYEDNEADENDDDFEDDVDASEPPPVNLDTGAIYYYGDPPPAEEIPF